VAAAGNATASLEAYIFPTTTALYRFLYTGQVAGSGTAQFNHSQFMIVEDVGAANGSNSVNNATVLGTGTSGAASGQSLTKKVSPLHTYTYWGIDATAHSAGGGRQTDTQMFQGNSPSTVGTGTQFAYMDFSGLFPALPAISGATIQSITLTITNIQSYYSTGTNLVLSRSTKAHSVGDPTSAATSIGTYAVGEGQTLTITLPNSVATALVAGTALSLLLGPGPGVGGGGTKATFGVFAGKGASGAPYLTVNYVTA
jgi:hypothetical protein